MACTIDYTDVFMFFGALGCVLVLVWYLGYTTATCSEKSHTCDPSKETVLITGCDSGIGYQCARLYDKLGFQVFAGCLFPNGPGAQQLAKETSRLQIIDLDITDEDKVTNAYRIVSSHVKTRGIWGMLNNAGVLCFGEFEWFSWNQCKKQIDVNLVGTIRMVKQFLPLIKMREGRILTITSVNGLIAYPGLSIYCATKFALEGFCNSLRLELKKNRVRVVTIQLGDFARLTNIFANHQKEVDEMWDSLSQEQRDNDGKYFWNFQKVAQETYGLTSPTSFENSQLFRDLGDAMMSSSAKNHYMCMSGIQHVVFCVLLALPTFLRDVIIHRIFKKLYDP